jgi:GDPmannose 4,6-dehydratase
MLFKDFLDLDPWKYIKIEDRYRRPNEVPALLGDSTKIRTKLGWEPKISLEEGLARTIDYFKSTYF